MNRSRITGDLVSQNNIFVDIANDRVGIGSTIPTAKLDVRGRAQIGGTNDIVGTPYSYFYGRGNGGDGVSVYAAEPSLELVGTNGGSHAASLLFRTAANDGIGFNYNPGGNTLELKSFDATNNNFQIHASGNNVSNLKNILKAISGGAVELYHNNVKKIETTAYGVNVTGTTDTDGLVVSGVTTTSDGIYLKEDATSGSSTKRLYIGAGDDLRLFHDSTNSYVQNHTGDLILGDTNHQYFRGNTSDKSVSLYFNGTEKFKTTNTGVNVSGTINATGGAFTGNLTFANNVGVLFGSGNPFQIYHNSGTSVIEHHGTGQIHIKPKATEHGIKIFPDGAVELYHDGSKRFETTSTGIQVADGSADINIRSGTPSNAGHGYITFENVDGNGQPRDVVRLQGYSTGNGGYGELRLQTAFNNTLSTRLAIHNTGNSTFYGDVTLTDTTADSAAGPELKLYRNSASPANADYLGQIKFAGESSTGVERNYAKITGKILDVDNGNEDGILEFAHIKNGSQTITGRWRSDSLQLLNGTALTVAGSTTVTGNIIPSSDSATDIGTNSVRFANIYGDTIYGDGSNLTGITQTTINSNADNRVITGSGTANTLNAEANLTFNGSTLAVTGAITASTSITATNNLTTNGNLTVSSTNPNIFLTDTNNDSDFRISNSNGVLEFRDITNTATRLQITSAGNIEIQGTRAGALQANDDDALKLFTKSTTDDINRGVGITFYTHDGGGYEMGGTIQVAKENGTTNNAASYMRFSTQSGSTTTERLRITSSGDVNIGNEDGYSIWRTAANDTRCKFQFRQTTGDNRGFALLEERGDTNCMDLIISKSRGGNGVGVISSGDNLGIIKFSGADGTRQHNGAAILAWTSGTIATGRIPTNLSFYTHPDSAGQYAERLRIASNGDVKVIARGSNTSGAPFYVAVTGKSSIDYGGGNDDTACLRIVDNGSTNSYYHGIELRAKRDGDARIYVQDKGSDACDLVFATDNSGITEKMRVTATGMVGIGNRTTSPNSLLHVHTSSGDANARIEGGSHARLRLTAHNGASILEFGDASSDSVGKITYNHIGSNVDSMVFRTAGTDRLTLFSNGKLDLLADEGIFVRSSGDNAGAKIRFSTNTQGSPNYNQIGHIIYYHGDDSIVSGYGEGFVVGGNQSNGFIMRVDGGINIIDSNTAGGNGAKLSLGTDQDMRIYHSGGDGFIDGTGTGGLRVRYNDVIFQNYNSSGTRRCRFYSDQGIEVFAVTNAQTNGARIQFSDASDFSQVGTIRYAHSDNSVVNDSTNECFVIEGTENQTALKLDGRMYISDSKFVLKPTFSNFNDIPNGTNSGNSVGCMMKYNDETNGNSGVMSNSAVEPFIANRSGSDGIIMRIRHQGNTEGNISVSGGQVSYNNFMGAHKAQFVDHSKPDILVGTVLETVDQIATWKYASFSVGVGTAATTKYIPYYGSKNDGETDSITFDSNTYSATIKDYRDPMPEMTKHVCVKVSDTVGSKAVFGVFNSWEEDTVVERESGNAEVSWNDLDVASIGNYFIRMQSGQTPEVGDYVESAGDGTAKVQSDDILRSKTIAKITSTIKQKTYSDGSFLVTCTLHCG